MTTKHAVLGDGVAMTADELRRDPLWRATIDLAGSDPELAFGPWVRLLEIGPRTPFAVNDVARVLAAHTRVRCDDDGGTREQRFALLLLEDGRYAYVESDSRGAVLASCLVLSAYAVVSSQLGWLLEHGVPERAQRLLGLCVDVDADGKA